VRPVSQALGGAASFAALAASVALRPSSRSIFASGNGSLANEFAPQSSDELVTRDWRQRAAVIGLSALSITGS
jgi:hypothetical protein